MGMVAALSAVRSDVVPTREAFEERLERSLDPPNLSLPAEFTLDLSGVWRALLSAFTGGEYDRLVGDGEGVWAIRGRHPVVPHFGRIERFYEVSLYYNDGEDVAAISAWLAADPIPEFVSYFRAQHEQYVDDLVKEGLSEREIRLAAGGIREEAPYLEHWERLREFYERAKHENLWVECYIR